MEERMNVQITKRMGKHRKKQRELSLFSTPAFFVFCCSFLEQEREEEKKKKPVVPHWPLLRKTFSLKSSALLSAPHEKRSLCSKKKTSRFLPLFYTPGARESQKRKRHPQLGALFSGARS
jgi:hypothetical protein